ncbi:MAG: LytR/AlgR family response regulator transcription factor [Breznakia sp.]
MKDLKCIKACLVDDDEQLLKYLSRKMSAYDDFEVATYTHIQDKRIYNQFYDVYFLDVDMEIEKAGFILAKKIYAYHPHALFVFVSNHENLVYESFHYHAIFFLRKSEIEKELKKIMDSVKTRVVKQNKTYIHQNDYALHNIPYQSILQFRKESNTLYTITQNAGCYRERKSLSTLLVELQVEEQPFYLVNQSEIVNLMFVKEVHQTYLTLRNNDRIDISRRRKKGFQNAYLMYLQSKK